MKLTGWYQGDQKPVRVGFYERKLQRGRVVISFFNGENFYVGKKEMGYFWFDHRQKTYIQNLPWRGVAK